MQLLHILDTENYDTWKSGFDTRTEQRMRAGLTLMQMWHADAPGRVICLYEANDRSKAEGWLEQAAAMHDGVKSSTYHFLRTA